MWVSGHQFCQQEVLSQYKLIVNPKSLLIKYHHLNLSGERKTEHEKASDNFKELGLWSLEESLRH